MAAVDPADGILKWGNDDVVTPFSTKMNAHLDSVGSVTNALSRRSVYFVANESERTSLVSQVGIANITQAKPLIVWRANAPVGKNLEYSINGGSSWPYYSSSADVSGWVALPLSAGFSVMDGFTPMIKREGSTILARGRIQGTFVTGNTFATLPTGFTSPAWITDVALTRNSNASSQSAVVRGQLIDNALKAWFGTSTTAAPTWVGLPPVLYVES